MQPFEQLGRFYLGRTVDPKSGTVSTEDVLYDAKDLTTHGLLIGMTGSGKTGLGVALIEEALIDGIPVLAIDPKGDLANLLLAFPELRAEDFLPWIDESEALRKGRTPLEHAQATARTWKEGLATWGQDGERVARYAQSAERTVYTPGSTAGRPIALLQDFAPPPLATRDDPEAFGDRVAAVVGGLLGLLGIDADPVRSREAILVSSIVTHAWNEGRGLDLPTLIQQIQTPPFDKVGVIDLESFHPARERFELAMQVNNLLASPRMAVWMQGDPLDVGALLYTPEGRPRLSVISIAHLDDAERMFFVTLLLNEVLAWTRAQSGTSSLRALVYMDEIHGYVPPVANPPTKRALLALLKQARAFGVGLVLSTQNPVDLDYKALSNIGTWWLGRLQTERDKERVLEGLRGTSTSAEDLAAIDALLTSLAPRNFLMRNVHEDAPVLLQTRWVLSYLAGPMTREQIARLRDVTDASRTPAPPPSAPANATVARAATPAARPPAEVELVMAPVLPPGIEQRYLHDEAPRGGDVVYRPFLAARASLHHVLARLGVDEWSEVVRVVALDDAIGSDPWREADTLDPRRRWSTQPLDGARYTELPALATRADRHATWRKSLVGALYATSPVLRYECRAPRLASTAGEGEGAFRARVRLAQREERDRALEKLRARQAPKLARLQERIRTAAQAVQREAEQVRRTRTDTAISVGATVIGALFGRKLASASTVSRASSSVRSAGRIGKEQADVQRAQETEAALRAELERLQADSEAELTALREAYAVEEPEVVPVEIAPRKADVAVQEMVVLWVAGGL